LLNLDSYAPDGGWQKPDGIRIVAVVFYGRRRNVDILDCYLQQNLASNDGYLDEVRFLVHTEDEEDLSYLEGLVAQTDQYTVRYPGPCQGDDFSCMWSDCVDDNTVYVKIDDDVVSIKTFVHGDKSLDGFCC
jgi:hypothetical protein